MSDPAQLSYAYARAIDTCAWELMDDVFTDDAVADYGALGGVKEGRAAIVEFLRDARTRWDVTQHFITNVSVAEDGTATCYFLAHHVREGRPVWIVGGEYHDRLAGGRIAHRTLIERWRR